MFFLKSFVLLMFFIHFICLHISTVEKLNLHPTVTVMIQTLDSL